MPPMITRPTRVAATRPVIQVATPNSSSSVSATVLAWTALPVRNEVHMSAKAKNIATGFQAFPRPCSM